MSQLWHYRVGEETKGPVSLEEIASLVDSNLVTRTVEVRAEGTESWVSFASAWKETGIQAALAGTVKPINQSFSAGVPRPVVSASHGQRDLASVTTPTRRMPRWMKLTVILLLVGAGFGLYWFAFRSAPLPDFDKQGGTILVYELAADEGAADMEALAKAVESRLSSDIRDLPLILVQAGKHRQISVRIFRSAGHEETVEWVRRRIAESGRMEFKVLANEKDDSAGIDAATVALDRSREKAVEFAEHGLPPPGPQNADGTPKFFPIMVNGQKSLVSYRWVELSPSMLDELKLSPRFKGDPLQGKSWELAEKMSGGTFYLPEAMTKRRMLAGASFHARTCLNRILRPEEREARPLDVFVLVRDEDMDPEGGKIMPQLLGQHLTAVMLAESADERPAVNLNLNAEGAGILERLSRINQGSHDPDAPEGQFQRHLGVVLNEKLLMAPTIRSVIKDRVQISGNFTQKEVQFIANSLRAGQLPARLHVEPVAVIAVEPRE